MKYTKELPNLHEYQEKALALAYFTDKVQFGRFDGKEFEFAEEVCMDFLREVIIFNKNKQFRYKYSLSQKKFLQSVLDDTDKNYFQYDVFLKGRTVQDVKNGFVFVEEAGSILAIPSDREYVVGDSFAEQITVRQYYAFDEKYHTMIKKGTRLLPKEGNNA